MNTLPFLSFADKLKDLLGWCEHPADEPLSQAWLDVTKDELRAAARAAGAQSRHDRSLAKKVERAESLGLELATLLQSHPDIAMQPIQQWTVKRHRDLFDALASLESEVRAVGEAEPEETQPSPILQLVAEDATDKGLRELRTATTPPDTRPMKEQIKDFAYAVTAGFVPAFTAAHQLAAVLPSSPQWNKEADSLIASLESTCRILNNRPILHLMHKASRWLHQNGLPTDYRITVTESFGSRRLHERSACETMLAASERMLRGAYRLRSEPVPTTEGLNTLLTVLNTAAGFSGGMAAQPGTAEAHHIWATLGIGDWQECDRCTTAANAEVQEMLAQVSDEAARNAAQTEIKAVPQAAPRTASAWKLLRAAHIWKHDAKGGGPWSDLIEALATVIAKLVHGTTATNAAEHRNQQKMDEVCGELRNSLKGERPLTEKLDAVLREQFAYETLRASLVRLNDPSDGDSECETRTSRQEADPSEVTPSLYGAAQVLLDDLFSLLGAEWVEKQVRELPKTFRTEVAEMGLESLVEAAPAAGGSKPEGADQTPDGKRSAGPSGADKSRPGERKMPDRLKLALASWEHACQKLMEINGKAPTYREAHQWLKDEGPVELEVHCDFNSWCRYIRGAEQWENGKQNTPRRGRTGRSIIHHSERDSANGPE